jgi:ribosome maturation factor RimP
MSIIPWEVGVPAFFCCFYAMNHPVIPQIIDLAAPIAENLGLEVVGAVFQTNKQPPVLRIDIRNLAEDTNLDDCQKMSLALEPILDETELIPGAYVLEISSPGISRELTTDREFISFKGFAVIVKTINADQTHRELKGNLQGRDQETVYLNQKGRAVSIPRQLVVKVQLDEYRAISPKN